VVIVPISIAIPSPARPAGPGALPFQEEIDPLAPQREAAMFYGLFLRGHSADALRRDIDVPKKLLDKLMRRHRNELAVQARLQRVYTFRKQVLAIFDELVTRERATGPTRVH
jgi:hypothetical protein